MALSWDVSLAEGRAWVGLWGSAGSSGGGAPGNMRHSLIPCSAQVSRARYCGVVDGGALFSLFSTTARK